MTLKSRLEVTQLADWYASHIHRWQCRSIFIGCYTTSSGKLDMVRWRVTVLQGHSKSSKLEPIESSNAVSYIIFRFNYVPIFYRFLDITIYLSEICVVPHFTHRSLVWRPSDLRYEICFQNTRFLGSVADPPHPPPESATAWATRLAVWLSGSTLASINVVALRQTRLVLGWVTVCGRVNHLGM